MIEISQEQQKFVVIRQRAGLLVYAIRKCEVLALEEERSFGSSFSWVPEPYVSA